VSLSSSPEIQEGVMPMRGLGWRWRSFFARTKKQGPSTEKLKERIDRVAESILDNERLTADLDDSAAKELLDWGLAAAKQIVQGTADVDDDDQAQAAMYPRLRATRRMMRAVNIWVTKEREGDVEGSTRALDRILEQASIVYGRAFTSPSTKQRDAFVNTQAKSIDNPPQMIANLRLFLEQPDDAQTNQEGES
jgi:hypothetical protein